jgi:hypothetical protein
MSLTQWKAIFDRLAAIERRLDALEAAPMIALENARVEHVEPLRRGPGRPRKVTDGQA